MGKEREGTTNRVRSSNLEHSRSMQKRAFVLPQPTSHSLILLCIVPRHSQFWLLRNCQCSSEKERKMSSVVSPTPQRWVGSIAQNSLLLTFPQIMDLESSLKRATSTSTTTAITTFTDTIRDCLKLEFLPFFSTSQSISFCVSFFPAQLLIFLSSRIDFSLWRQRNFSFEK